jgi:hypothetical protein
MANGSDEKKHGDTNKVLIIIIGALISLLLGGNLIGLMSFKSDFETFKTEDFKILREDVSTLKEKRETYQERFDQIGERLNKLERKIFP